MKTAIQTERAYVALVEDGLGRRIVVGALSERGVTHKAVVVAVTREEAREMSNALRNLLGDLPERAQ